MSADLFNSLAGYSVNIPPIPVIDANGNITSNTGSFGELQVAGNVTANFFLGNVVGNVSGNFVVPGTNTSIIFNQEGNAGASDQFQFNYASNVVTLVGNLSVSRIFTDNYLYANGDPFVFQAQAAGSNRQVQYNANGLLGADSNFYYDPSLELLYVENFQSDTIETYTLIVNSNAQADYFIGNFVGNLSNANTVSANYLSGTLTTNDQPNITSLGNLTGLTVTGTGSFLNVVATSVTGNVLNGTLTTQAQPNITSLGTLTGLTVNGNGAFNNINGGNLVSANFISGVLTTATQANITTVGNLQNLNVVSNLQVGNNIQASTIYATTINGSLGSSSQPNITSVGTLTNLSVAGNVTANNFIGNLIGSISNANYALNANHANFANVANLASSVTTSFQPNITSLGTLTFLNVSGNIIAGNVNSNFAGNGSRLFDLPGGNVTGIVSAANTANIANIAYSVAGANVSGVVANANYASYAGQANTANSAIISASANSVAGANVSGVVANANYASYAGNANVALSVSNGSQPNITSVGTLTSLTVSGNVAASNFIGNFVGNIANANFATYASYIVQNAQPNITSVGDLVSLSVQGNLITNNFSSNGNISGNNLSITNIANINILSVTGDLGASNGNIPNLTTQTLTANSITANTLSGSLITGVQPNIYQIGNLGFLNIYSNVANSNGNITFSGSISGVGPQSNIDITGNMTAGGYVAAPLLIGYLSVNSQPNINEVGTLTGLTVNGISNLGNVGNLKIFGGSANYVLTTDGLGNLSWGIGGGGNGGGTPGGLDTYVQFNANGVFGGVAGFTFTQANNTLNVTRVNATTLTGTLTTGSQPNITTVGSLANLVVVGNTTTGNIAVTGNASFSNVSISNSLSLTGNFSAGNISTPGQLNTTGLTVTGNATFTNNATISSSGILRINGNLNAGNSANVYLGNVSNVKIDGGINGYVLQTDGAGGLSWTAQTGGGGNGVPGGSNTQVQYNDTGAFGGSAFFTFNENTNTVTVAGNLIANSFQMGAGIYRFSYSNVYQAITNTSNANQILWSVEADQISGVDFVIVSTDANANVRQVSKIFAVVLGSDVNYNETNTIAVNGYNGDFSVQYDPGNIITQPTVGLYFSPQSGNTMTHKMQITTYDN